MSLERRIRSAALRLLARREHARAELQAKLERRLSDDEAAADPAAAIAAVLDDLQAHGLLDDDRTAATLVRAKASRFGAHRLRRDLRARGIAPQQAEAALHAVAGSEIERARQIWQRRFGEVARDPAERARQARFLAGRGFSGDCIRRVIGGDAGDAD